MRFQLMSSAVFDPFLFCSQSLKIKINESRGRQKGPAFRFRPNTKTKQRPYPNNKTNQPVWPAQESGLSPTYRPGRLQAPKGKSPENESPVRKHDPESGPCEAASEAATQVIWSPEPRHKEPRRAQGRKGLGSNTSSDQAPHGQKPA